MLRKIEDIILAAEQKLTKEQKHISPENMVWEGDVPEGHLIESTGGTLTINGNLGIGAIAKSKYGLTVNGDAKKTAMLIAQNGVITLKKAEDGVLIKSVKLFVKLENIGNNAIIEANDYIKVINNIGSDCNISTGRWVSAKVIGKRTIIRAEGDVTADIISNNTNIIAKEGAIFVKRVEEFAYIRARYDIRIEESAAKSADIESGDRGVVVEGGLFRSNEKKPQPSSFPQGKVNINVNIGPGVRIEKVELNLDSSSDEKGDLTHFSYVCQNISDSTPDISSQNKDPSLLPRVISNSTFFPKKKEEVKQIETKAQAEFLLTQLLQAPCTLETVTEKNSQEIKFSPTLSTEKLKKCYDNLSLVLEIKMLDSESVFSGARNITGIEILHSINEIYEKLNIAAELSKQLSSLSFSNGKLINTP